MPGKGGGCVTARNSTPPPRDPGSPAKKNEIRIPARGAGQPRESPAEPPASAAPLDDPCALVVAREHAAPSPEQRLPDLP